MSRSSLGELAESTNLLSLTSFSFFPSQIIFFPIFFFYYFQVPYLKLQHKFSHLHSLLKPNVMNTLFPSLSSKMMGEVIQRRRTGTHSRATEEKQPPEYVILSFSLQQIKFGLIKLYINHIWPSIKMYFTHKRQKFVTAEKPLANVF